NGRDHNHYGFTMWLAGGGVKGGYIHGATDEFGFQAVENKVHVHDLHATILWLLGFNHERLTYRYAGRDFRLTDVPGRVVRELIAGSARVAFRGAKGDARYPRSTGPLGTAMWNALPSVGSGPSFPVPRSRSWATIRSNTATASSRISVCCTSRPG